MPGNGHANGTNNGVGSNGSWNTSCTVQKNNYQQNKGSARKDVAHASVDDELIFQIDDIEIRSENGNHQRQRN